MKGHPNTYHRSAKIREIEAEFDQPFHEVLAGFAADGHNVKFTAEVLGIDPDVLYRKLQTLAKAGYTFDWPCPYATRRRVEHPNTPAQRAASAANLLKRDPNKAAPWGNPRKATRELVERATALRAEHRLSWRQVAKRVGIDPRNLHRARKLYNIEDPLGDALIRQAQRQFTQRRI